MKSEEKMGGRVKIEGDVVWEALESEGKKNGEGGRPKWNWG